MDQAETLRRMMQQRGSLENSGPTGLRAPKILTFASGKGGVGKSTLVSNLGALLARNGHKVLLVDGDFGLANLDIILGVLGVHNDPTLEDVLSGRSSIQETIVGVERNLWLLPSSSGFMAYRHSPIAVRAQLLKLFESCPWEMDYILVDAGAGIQENVQSVHSPQFQSVMVLTPEPTSLADAYGLIKVLRKTSAITRASILVNQVDDGREGQAVFQRLKEVVTRFLDVEIAYIGHCVRDEKFTQAVMKRKILLDLYPGAASIPCLELIAKRLGAETGSDSSVRRPWSRFKDEPARMAPGNTAGFFKALLGEVKA